jgi:uncharacterized protein (TIGR03435 family)
MGTCRLRRLTLVGRCLIVAVAGCVGVAIPNTFARGDAVKSGASPQATGVAVTLPSFEVASVRENKSDEKNYSNFPLNSGPQYGSVGGLFVARNMLLLQYLVFAYKPNMFQIQEFRLKLPDWTRTSHFDIQAHANGSPTKDDMRLMMQSLLTERFQMKVHHEMREVSVFALVLVKPGQTGPNLQPHPVDDPECLKTQLPKSVAGAYPVACGAAASIAPTIDGDAATAGYNVSMEAVANALGGTANIVDRPVLDRTGLKGNFDFKVEFAPESAPKTDPTFPTGPAFEIEPGGPSFRDALKKQLGLKIVLQEELIDVIVIDHLERPSEN